MEDCTTAVSANLVQTMSRTLGNDIPLVMTEQSCLLPKDMPIYFPVSAETAWGPDASSVI